MNKAFQLYEAFRPEIPEGEGVGCERYVEPRKNPAVREEMSVGTGAVRGD